MQTGPNPDRLPVSASTFADLACLSPTTLLCLTELGFTHATPVQQATLPLFCGHKDVAVEACTGSGKTLAFVVPVVEKLRGLPSPLTQHQARSPAPRPGSCRLNYAFSCLSAVETRVVLQVGAMIVSPTRELAKQTFAVLQPFLQTLPWAQATLLVGGR